MKDRIESLKEQVLLAAVAEPSVIEDLGNRPVFLIAPNLFLGKMFATRGAVVAVVDDASTEATLHGLPRWTSKELLERAGQYPGALAIDFSETMPRYTWTQRLCELAGIERRDCVAVHAQMGRAAVYETCQTYRSKTLERLDDFIRLADRLDDDLSRLTLFSNLLFRLDYDRSHLLKIWADPSDEYFSAFGDSRTFRLGSNEHYVDCGAYQGPIVHKFLQVTGNHYGSITAFEPDRINFEKLQAVSTTPLQEFYPIRKAVSSRRQTLRFKETGTVSSYVSADGDVTVETVRLDDEVNKVTFLKMDIEGFETDALKGARHLLTTQRPRAAVCVYHYAHCLLRVMEQFDAAVEDYNYRLRQHCGNYYYDLVLYASPVKGIEPPAWAA